MVRRRDAYLSVRRLVEAVELPRKLLQRSERIRRLLLRTLWRRRRGPLHDTATLRKQRELGRQLPGEQKAAVEAEGVQREHSTQRWQRLEVAAAIELECVQRRDAADLCGQARQGGAKVQVE